MNSSVYQTIRYSAAGTVTEGRKLCWLCDVDYGVWLGGNVDGTPGQVMSAYALDGPDGGNLTIAVKVDGVTKASLTLTPAGNNPDGSNGPAGVGSMPIFVAPGQMVTIEVTDSDSPVAQGLAVSVYYRPKTYSHA